MHNLPPAHAILAAVAIFMAVVAMLLNPTSVWTVALSTVAVAVSAAVIIASFTD